MAVEISTTSGYGESVSLRGEDAARFMEEVANPSRDARRLAHLERSDKAYERFFSAKPISKLPADE